MNTRIRRLVVLHRAALNRWRVHADRRFNALGLSGSLNYPALVAATARMDMLDGAMTRIQRRLAAL